MSFTQNAVCEHSLLFMQNVPYSYLVWSMGVLSFQINYESVLIHCVMFLKILN